MLSLLGSIYGKVIDVRDRLYDLGIFESFDLGAKTISIGNISAGGTGKTPLTLYVAEILADRGERVCILTRGYGRKDPQQRVLVCDGETVLADSHEAGDEPFELAQRLIGKAIVIADADRVAAAEWAKRKFGITAFVLDDGFQHRKVKRDVDIVCIDATDPFGGGNMLPAGRLREPVANLKRADIVIITRADLISEISNLRSEISDLALDAAIFEARTEILGVDSLESFHAKAQRTQSEEHVPAEDLQTIKNIAAFVFCGIGNPENFFKQLKLNNFSIKASHPFRDHHVYTQKNIDDITMQARANNAKLLLTTAKDAVKLMGVKFEIPCYVVEIMITVDDAPAFAAML
ncbi:MAG: tetraacyldisaccharide 4'-kinase [Chloracidobacterium sp.]|nr:tetraacyldisaccharide 4'-kinase [Chloracidobacterium sp.]